MFFLPSLLGLGHGHLIRARWSHIAGKLSAHGAYVCDEFPYLIIGELAAEAGHTAIVDATFLDTKTRRDLEAAIGPTGVRFLGIWLQAPLALLEQRVAARTGDASDATVAVLRRSAENDPGKVDWLAVDASDATDALAAVRQALLNVLA